MGLTDIVELTVCILGVGAVGLALNKVRKRYVNWAEENKFYDEKVLEEDMKDKEKPINYNQSN